MLHVGARDAVTGAGIPGATVYRQLRNELLSIGTTDKDGITEIEVNLMLVPNEVGAHELRNPLASMSGSIQILRQELPLNACLSCRRSWRSR